VQESSALVMAKASENETLERELTNMRQQLFDVTVEADKVKEELRVVQAASRRIKATASTECQVDEAELAANVIRKASEPIQSQMTLVNEILAMMPLQDDKPKQTKGLSFEMNLEDLLSSLPSTQEP
jgi:ABC-type transport system involved in cytochrome bd biosynthesis fused ATPase/permease subunit